MWQTARAALAVATLLTTAPKPVSLPRALLSSSSSSSSSLESSLESPLESSLESSPLESSSLSSNTGMRDGGSTRCIAAMIARSRFAFRLHSARCDAMA